jgi:uncharacterized protein YdcH (DUF465 family)
MDLRRLGFESFGLCLKDIVSVSEMSYFWSKTRGVNADVVRHRNKLAELDAKIAELENKNDPESEIVLAAYRNLRSALLQSKAEVVEQIGKNKRKP